MVDQQIADMFRDRNKDLDTWIRKEWTHTRSIFTKEDIAAAIKDTNFDKGVGCDAFDGRILKQSKDLQDGVTTLLCEMLNTNSIPNYM